MEGAAVMNIRAINFVQGRVLDSWGVEHNAAAPPPPSPVKSPNPMETIILLPFGATDLRISEFPVLDEE